MVSLSITFKYKKIERPAPLDPNYTPSIPVTLINNGKSVDVVALLDSGADVSFIPRGIAEILDIDISKGKRTPTVGLGGEIETIDAKISVLVQNAHERYRFSIATKIPVEDKDRFPIILGRRDFFDKFDIVFKEKERKIILRKT